VTAETERRRTRTSLEEAAEDVLWWPSAVTLLIVGFTYAFISNQITIGPPAALLVILAISVGVISILSRRRLLRARRIVALVMLGLATLLVASSAVFLLISPSSAQLEPLALLRDAALLWVSNILVFGLWYWELDGGGPVHRMLPSTPPSTDFAFPPQQQAALTGQKDLDWSPLLLDYLFLAFTSSSTFGPTDTLVMARRAKALMMVQACLSLIIFGGIVARAVGSLH
jgi:hypothetical protein